MIAFAIEDPTARSFCLRLRIETPDPTIFHRKGEHIRFNLRRERGQQDQSSDREEIRSDHLPQ
jgi:hypothetical protein